MNKLENFMFVVFTITMLSLGYMADSLMDDNITVIEKMESYPYYDYDENESEIRNDAGLFSNGGVWTLSLNDTQLFHPLNGQVVYKQVQYNGSEAEWFNQSYTVFYWEMNNDYTTNNQLVAPIFGGNWTICTYTIIDGCMPPYGFEPYSYSVVYQIIEI